LEKTNGNGGKKADVGFTDGWLSDAECNVTDKSWLMPAGGSNDDAVRIIDLNNEILTIHAKDASSSLSIRDG
jgi:hypothetical protein